MGVGLTESIKCLFDPPMTPVQRQFWDDNGFLILPGQFSGAHIQGVLDEVEAFWSRSRREKMKTVIDIYIGTPNERRVRLHDAPDDAKLKPHKLNDLFLESEAVRQTVLEPKLTRILGALLNGKPLCCNSLNFIYGSGQTYHTDSLYMTPPKKLYLAATWIALEDCHPDAGPLRYYPASHKIPPFRFSNGSMHFVDAEMPKYHDYMQREVAARGLKEERFCAKKGDVLIWHSQLFHAGSPINDPTRTRRSLVTHYFRKQDMRCAKERVGELGYYMKREPQPI